MESMKYIYAYNPDYDSLTVNVGDVTIQDYYPYFTSNIISTNSALMYPENKSFNDYIYLG
jgi:hypothetical protein